MDVPFTTEQFFSVIEQYNETLWPAQVVLNLLAIAAIVLLIHHRPYSDRAMSVLLALLWLWTGLTYHLTFFTTINKAAYLFAGFYLLAAGLFFWFGVVKGRLRFVATNAVWRGVGAILIFYALLVYPLLSLLLGHGYPKMPTFGLPCPSTIFTIGMLCFLVPPYPRSVLLVPVLWTIVGAQAAFLFGVYQDLGLLVAGVVGVAVAYRGRSGQ